MKIAIFTDTFYPQVNGVANTLKKLGDYLTESGNPYIFISPKTKHEHRIPYNMLSFFSIPFVLYPECSFTLVDRDLLNRQLDSFKPDVIFLMTEFNVGLTGLKYAKSRNLPVISNYSTNFASILHSYHLGLFEPVLNSYLKWFHNASDLTLTPSEPSRLILSRLKVKRTEIFGRGIDTHMFNPAKRSQAFRDSTGFEDRILLLYVGRLSAEKDLDLLRTTMFQLNHKYYDQIALVITGDGPMKVELEETMPDNVIFTGYKKGNDLAEVYASCDIFTFPSPFETFGNVVLEAFASGLCVLGVNEGGVMNLIDHGENGYLAKSKDVNDFSYHLEKLILESKKREVFARNAMLFVQTKSWENIFNQLMDVFQKQIIIKNSQRPNLRYKESSKKFSY